MQAGTYTGLELGGDSGMAFGELGENNNF